MMTKVLYVLIGMMVIVIAVFGYAYATDTQPWISLFSKEEWQPEMSGGVFQQRDQWASIISAVGPHKAYEMFLAEYKDDHFGMQHTMAHIMGELLYETQSLEGLKVCDSSFAFGCYHSFFGRAVAEQGIEILPQLDQACVEKFGPLGSGCQHGIGHGVIEYFGHDEKGLAAALDSCKHTTQVRPLAGCTSGVFMEFNTPIRIDGMNAVSDPRPFVADRPFYPCDVIKDIYRDSCYFEIPQWWNQIPELHKDFAAIGELCQDVADDGNRISCFLGVGNTIGPQSNYQVDISLTDCSHMPTQKGIAECRAGASWSFYANPDYRERASELCRGLTPADTTHCQFVDDASDKKLFIPQQ